MNATAQGIPGMTSWATTATTVIVNSTRTIASSEITRRFSRRSRRFAKNAAA